MKKMFRGNRPHTKTKIKPERKLQFVRDLDLVLGTGQFDRSFPFHFICPFFQGQIEHSSFKMERVKLFQSKQSIHTEGFNPLSVEVAL